MSSCDDDQCECDTTVVEAATVYRKTRTRQLPGRHPLRVRLLSERWRLGRQSAGNVGRPVVREPMLKVDEHDDHTRVEVLQPCSVRWSEDCSTWYQVLDEAPVGTVVEDYDAGLGHRRSYSACVNNQTVEVYYEMAAREQFAQVMRRWFPPRSRR